MRASSAHIADVHVDLPAIAGDAGGAAALPHIAGDGAAGYTVVCVPDAVARQAAQIHPLAEPQGRSVDAGLVALRLDLLAESDGTLGAVLDAQTVGTAILAAGGLSIEVDGVVELAAVQDIGTALRFFPGLVR